MYAKGQGTSQDFSLSYAWLNLSVAQDCKTAIRLKNIVAEKLSSEQLIEAQELSLKLLKKQS